MSKANEECCQTVLSALRHEKTECGKCSKDVRRSEKCMQDMRVLVTHQVYWYVRCIGMSDVLICQMY